MTKDIYPPVNGCQKGCCLVQPTLTLVLCGIPSRPSSAGSVTSHLPKSLRVIGVASLFQSS